MRLTGSRAYVRPTPVPKMPPGMVELMEDLTRDVLKNNPADIYEFCAGHMRKLLEIRDGPLSLKPPLTLKQKIALAQEKVRKRGEARWQKYLKENKANRSKRMQEKKTDIEEINAKLTSSVVQHVLKPPVYPDLNVENASEIEISHESGDVFKSTDLENVEGNRKEDTIDNKGLIACIKVDDKNAVAEKKELSANVKKIEHVPSSNSIEMNHNNTDNSTDDEKIYTHVNNSAEAFPNAEQYESVNKVISVPENKNIDELEAIKTEVKHNQNISECHDDKNEEEPGQCEMEVKSVNLPNASKSTDIEIKNEIIHKLDDKQENVPDVKNNFNKSEQKIEVNNTLSDLGTLVNTAVSVLNVFSENACTLHPNAETTEIITNAEKKSDLVKNENRKSLRLDVAEADLSTENILPIDIESISDKSITTEYFDEKNEKLVDNDILGTCVIKSIEDDKDNVSNAMEQYSASTNVSDAQNIHEDISNVDNQEQANVSIILPIVEDNKSENVKVTESDNILQGSTEDTESNKNGFEPPIIHINDIINENPENKDNFDSQILSAMDKVDVIVEPEVSLEVHDISPSVDIKLSDTSIATNSPQILHVEEPSANVLDIYETENVQEPNEGNIIEIRISQVAEALNNEGPVASSTESVKLLVEPELPLNSSTDNEKNNGQFLNVFNANKSGISELPLDSLTDDEVNAQMLSVTKNGLDDMCTEEENEVQLFPNAIESDETPSIGTFVDNTDDLHNVETANAIKSLSIDESTDGMDNTSLMESGTSEATDDVMQQNSNNHSMDLETAAVTIQKVFRSFLFKSRASTFDDNDDNISLDEDNEKKDELEFQASNTNMNKERRGISRMDTVLQTVNEEKSLSLSTDDSSTLSSAATTIQAHVRGFLVRNKLHSHKTASTNSLVNLDGPSASLDWDTENKNKTILNIHIVPEGGNYLSRDESMLTSMDLSLDGSPPSSLNLHPLGYDKNERRKRLKREDAIQSISPPSNNSGKLSEDVDSVKDMLITEGEIQNDYKDLKDEEPKKDNTHNRPGSGDTSPTTSLTIETVIEAHKLVDQESTDADTETPVKNKRILTKQSSDEMDVVTPFEDKSPLVDSRSTSKLMHSGEFHDIVLPTKVSRSDAAVVSEFKNVLVYFLLWNNS